jgi:hypothetical protein
VTFGESTTYVYNPVGPTVVGGVTYDVVIQWLPVSSIDFSWEIYPDTKRDPFDCSATKMWFGGLTVGATTYFRGRKGDEPYCVFDMQNGILSQSYLSAPGNTVFFLLSGTAANGNIIYIDKNYDLPVVPSDNYDPAAFDPTIVCDDPAGPSCNVIDTVAFTTNIVSFDYISPGGTTVGGVSYDVVVQWVPPVGTSITSSWEIFPERVQDPFNCGASRMWFNGTVVGATTYFRGSQNNQPYCVFDIHDGILGRDYMASPGRTVFFLLSTITGPGDLLFIQENYDKPVVALEDYDPAVASGSIVCDDPTGPSCNVVNDVSFVGQDSVNLLYPSIGPTLVNGTTYNAVVKWLVGLDTPITHSWEIYPENKRDPFDCSTTKMWFNGTVVGATTFLRGTKNDEPYCVFDIHDGILSRDYLQYPANTVFFLLDSLTTTGTSIFIDKNFDKPVVALEDYDPAASSGSIVCDDPLGPSCNVESSISFINQDPVSLPYPSLGPTTVQGVTYDAVVKWVVDSSAVITHSWEIYPERRQDPFDCSTTKMWFNGTVVGATSYMRGSQNNEPYCIFDIHDGVLSSAILNNPQNKVFFLLETMTTPGTNIFIAKNFVKPVVALENIIFYLYDLVTLQTTSTDAVGSTFTFTVANKTYSSPSFNGPGNCNSMETVMTNYVNIGTCSLGATTVDNVNGVYSFDLAKGAYGFCADSRVESGNTVTYTFTVTLPTTAGSCHYFNPLQATRVVTVEIPTNKDTGGSGGTGGNDVQYSLEGYSLERCEEESYLVAQAKIVFLINFTYSGISIDLNKIPYLDNVENTLDIVSKNCTTSTTGDDYCVYELRTSECKPLLSTSVGHCVFDRYKPHKLYDLDVEQLVDQSSQISTVTVIPTIDTTVEYEVWSGEVCNTNVFNSVVNVSDQYQSIMKIRNRPWPDWENEPQRLNFFEEIVVRVELNSTGAEGSRSEIQISTVEFILFDSNTRELITTYVFNKGDKERLLDREWTLYYKDVHFCSYKYENGTCAPFYEEGSTRVNNYTRDNLLPQIADLCQTGENSTINDHFTFRPLNWFKSIKAPLIDIEIRVTSLLTVCDGDSGSKRTLLENSLSYTSSSLTVKAATATGTRPPFSIIIDTVNEQVLRNSYTLSFILAGIITLLVIYSTGLTLRYLKLKDRKYDLI